MHLRPIFGALVLASLVSCQPIQLEKPAPEKPLHEKATAAAWNAFKAGQYEEALTSANLCIQEFHGVAARRQKELGDKARIPNGVVTAEQKTSIFQNGAMNDVAVAYYLKGRSADKLGRRTEAVKALLAATQLPAARAWDARGWMWSPADAAERYLAKPELADAAPHEIYTADAWAAYKRGDYKVAIARADRCATEFQIAALELEGTLAKRNERLPTGAVDEATRAKIFANGLLNDVGTILYVKGRSAEAVGNKKLALEAYHAAQKYTLARCWDPRGWFWSPAEASGDRIELLR